MKTFAKIFPQIFDSSIARDLDVRTTFMDMLILADYNGVVDMTHDAIARRTNRPEEAASTFCVNDSTARQRTKPLFLTLKRRLRL